MGHSDWTASVGESEKPYVVTLDVDGLINWRGWLVENVVVAPVREQTLADLMTMVPQPLDTYGYQRLKLTLEGRIDDLLKHSPSAVVVGLDDVLYKPRQAKAVLSLTRYCESRPGRFEGSVIIGQTARPGARSVEEQLQEIQHHRELILTDVGCFDGEQMAFAVKLLREKGHAVIGIVVGILTSRAYHRLEGVNGPWAFRIPIIGCHYYGGITDWIEERDFYPFLGGIVVADKNGKVVEAPNGIGLACRRPYLVPFADIRERASINRKDAELVGFSRRQIERTIDLFEALESNITAEGVAVTFEDLKWLLRKPSFPYSGIPELDNRAEPRMKVTEFLRRALEFVR